MSEASYPSDRDPSDHYAKAQSALRNAELMHDRTVLGGTDRALRQAEVQTYLLEAQVHALLFVGAELWRRG